MIASVLLAAAPLAALRIQKDASEAGARSARARVDVATHAAQQAKADLDALEKAHAAGQGGWFFSGRERKLKATAHAAADALIAAESEARAAEARAESDREALREALFTDATAQTTAADAAADGGNAEVARAGYATAARDLAEATTLAPRDDPDPWHGLDAEIPLGADESPVRRAQIAAAYRASADAIAARLVALRRRLDAARSAAETFARLSRFRGVLERAGREVSDPASERDRLAAICAQGEAIEAKLRARADAVVTAHATIPDPQPEASP